MKRTLLTILAALLLSGCTYARYNVQTQSLTYLSVLQKKNFKVEPNSIEYNTASDPAVQLARDAFAAGLTAAKAVQ